jgi:tetratricopeptide (TPR) repeat protein
LHAKYPRSDARAFLALDEAQERSEKGDGASAIADLEQLEGIFDGRSAAGEITLLKAVLLEKNGKFEEALKEYKALLAVPGIAPDIAAECAVNSGEILFNRGNYQEAQQYFLQGAQRSPGTLFADVAIGKAVDCDLAQGRQLPAARQLENIARCERLAAATRYPQLRLQALFKLAKSYEQAGNYQEAVKACERLLYAAENIAGTGVRPDEIWCIRGTETALDIIIRHRFPGGLQRGMRMINHLEALKFPGVSGAGMRSNFREQYKKTRRK